ncbi:MFS transporter [Nocardia sp. NPDC051990]|uniref:MFS transporter n=1 Tax=Nocardia sp. NPDC051990 TaxID=3155285 RepID=UPI00343B98B2
MSCDAAVGTSPVIGQAARARLQRRTLVVVMASQVLGGAGLAAGVTVGALLAQQMLGGDGVAGAPAALYTLGSAAAALLVGRASQRFGRRIGLGAGFAVGGLGALGVVAAAVADNIVVLFAALLVYGAGTATNLQARYAATDLARPTERGRAISVAMVSTTLGAVAGPNLVQPLGRLATTLGIPALAGPFLLAGIAYLAAGAVLWLLLRPDPLLIARRAENNIIEQADSTVERAPAAGSAVPPPRAGAWVGAAVMVLTQVSMVAIMTMTPVHMRAHHHGLGQVGLVIGVHIGAMYLPSLATGALVDRIGRIPMAAAAGTTLLAAGITAAAAPGDSLVGLIVALALLGLGWNFGLIAGTALVVDATEPRNRPRVQGSIDVAIALAGAGGGAVSGVVVSATDYATLALCGGFLSLALLPVLWWTRRDHAPLSRNP